MRVSKCLSCFPHSLFICFGGEQQVTLKEDRSVSKLTLISVTERLDIKSCRTNTAFRNRAATEAIRVHELERAALSKT